MSHAPAVLIIGIGSPFANDRLGFECIERLRRDPFLRSRSHRVSLIAADRPGPRLIDLWSGARAVLLIDAIISGGPLGAVHRLEGEAIARARAPMSSHGFGVAEAVALARPLGQLPQRLVLYGIEMAGADDALHTSSAAMESAVARLTPRVIEEVRRWLDEDTDYH